MPGLIDNHLHIIRGGLNFNMELRWDGVRSLADAMAMLKRQVARTPPPQWVRVVGGFTEHQFAEKRLPTIDELNAVAPDTPVFMLHLYDRALLNARSAAGGRLHQGHAEPAGRRDRARRERQPDRTAARQAQRRHPLCDARPRGRNCRSTTRSTRRGISCASSTASASPRVIDAGGGFQNYPDDYAVIQKLHDDGQLTIRIAYNLFTQKPKEEKDDFLHWTQDVRLRAGRRLLPPQRRRRDAGVLRRRLRGFPVEPRPDMPPDMEGELEAVVRILAQNRWPWRLHATYDETISRALDVFEKVNRGHAASRGCNWFFDHAETITERSIDRIAALGGGIAVQHRMAYQGEYFVERYGAEAAEATPPVSRMLEEGMKVVAPARTRRGSPSYNPWVVARLARHRPHRRRLAHLPAAQLPRSRNRAADVDARTSPGSPTRKAGRDGSSRASLRTWSCLTAIISPCQKTRSRIRRLY